MRDLVRSVWREPRPPGAPARGWRDWGLVGLVCAGALAEGIARPDLPGRWFSIGVTVDSYVVFFERLKDEVKSGRSLRNSAQRGFRAAFRTILVADAVSLIGAAVLWYLSVGAVRGFA